MPNLKSKIKNLEIRDLRVAVGDKEIIKGVDLTIKPGEIHALMGPNGSGKSTLALGLAGHPRYAVRGKAVLDRTDLLPLKPEERAKRGLFLAFQYPVGIAGVSLFNFLKTTGGARGRKMPASQLLAHLKEKAAAVGLAPEMLGRELNQDFSGGEKKRAEVLQALALNPRFAVFDETDSGLDVDALRQIAKAIRALAQKGVGVLVVTHYQRILSHLEPDFVHVLVDGRIVDSGGKDLAEKLEQEGYHRYAR